MGLFEVIAKILEEAARPSADEGRSSGYGSGGKKRRRVSCGLKGSRHGFSRSGDKPPKGYGIRRGGWVRDDEATKNAGMALSS